jgi:cob(I)alamin adenosyltransferase
MGYRLSKIYTRTGDKGATGLGGGVRVDKDHPRVEAFGTVDELNSVIAMVLACELPDDVRAVLIDVQNDLFDLGSELAQPGTQLLPEEYVTRLEQILDRFNDALPPLQEFILPGGGMAAAHCHLARTVCRRAERRVVTLGKSETINPSSLHYLNRLSDLLFVLARVLARANDGEVLWQPGKNRGK